MFPVFFSNLADDCGFNAVDFDVFFKIMLSGFFGVLVGVGLEVFANLLDDWVHIRRGIGFADIDFVYLVMSKS